MISLWIRMDSTKFRWNFISISLLKWRTSLEPLSNHMAKAVLIENEYSNHSTTKGSIDLDKSLAEGEKKMIMLISILPHSNIINPQKFCGIFFSSKTAFHTLFPTFYYHSIEVGSTYDVRFSYCSATAQPRIVTNRKRKKIETTIFHSVCCDQTEKKENSNEIS